MTTKIIDLKGYGGGCRLVLGATSAPAVTDDTTKGFQAGDFWKVTDGGLYVADSVAEGAADWDLVGGDVAVSSGAWSGAAVAGTNIASIGNVTGSYIRVGNYVQFEGSVASVDPTAGAPTASDFEVPIPVASNFAATTDANGSAGSPSFYGAISASDANNRLVVSGTHTANTTGAIGLSGGYHVI